MNNLTSVVFAPRFNLCFSRLTVQFSTVKIVQHVFFQPITRTTNLKPIVNAYRSLSLVLSYRIIISWAYLFSFFFVLGKHQAHVLALGTERMFSALGSEFMFFALACGRMFSALACGLIFFALACGRMFSVLACGLMFSALGSELMFFRACLRAHVFRAWPVANALKRHTFQTAIKSILYCNDQRFD